LLFRASTGLAQELLGVVADVARGVVAGDPVDEVAGAVIEAFPAGEAREEVPANAFGGFARQRPAQEPVIGLNVRSGQFAACRDGVVSSRGKYPESKFQSGRVGFYWGGAVAGVIESLKITGRIDYERTFEDFARRRK